MRSRNVLLLYKEFNIGGAERNIITLAEELSRRGYRVISATQGGAWVSYLREKSSFYYELPHYGKNIFDFIPVVKVVLDIVKKEDIALIHSHRRFCSLVAWVVSKLTKVKVLSTVHNFDIDKTYITKWGDFVIAVSEKIKQLVVNNYNFDRKKVVVVYNGVSCPPKVSEEEKIKFILSWKLNRNHPIICNIGRLTKQKGHSVFLKAVKRVVQAEPKLQVLIVGDGELRDSLEEQTRKLSITDNVIFTGIREDVPTILQVSDFLVLSSLWEGLPYVIIEAMANRTPIVATNVGGVLEAVIDGYTGYLVEPNNEIDLADKILYLVRHKEKIKEFGGNAYNKIYKDRFTAEKMIDKTEEVYQKLLKMSDER